MTVIQSLRRTLGRGARPPETEAEPAPAHPALSAATTGPEVDIAPTDPLLAYLAAAPGPVDIPSLDLDSPAVRDLRAAGVVLVVPLVSQGELIGTLNLGPRLSEQEYSSDDRRLLTSLAAQAAPAVRVAQLVQEQAHELRERERFEQEMSVATLIQQQFLPRELPNLPEWQIAAYYGPARAVGGDFYDFIELPDGRLAIVEGDVTDKGVPAALVMARTHSILRGEAARLVSPAKVLARANELLVAEMPERMFVTCLYVVLDPATGHVVYANAGHNLPYVRTAAGVGEFRATGMPLGLLPDIVYEEFEGVIEPGASVLLYSDGMVEAHDPTGDMYGFPRLREAMGSTKAGSELLDDLLQRLHDFVGRGWEQEDDITMVTLRRSTGAASSAHARATSDSDGQAAATPADRDGHADEASIVDFEIPGKPGNERLAMERVAEAVAPLGIDPERLKRLKTAVSEATMNAIEYGSAGSEDVPVEISVGRTDGELRVRITDRALGGLIPTEEEAEEPDLEAKLAGIQKPRGWGLFLIRHMVDRVDVTPGDGRQTVTLTLNLQGEGDGHHQPA
ncbi:MAG TPA: SpoIIE family protein phosphatase [Candidatus Limnocylindrales bacterium]|jgi:serine phosphatase RsbU (regulator of sigma subunit)/anti-sigma regulatory factor (Ser/Thr protein kinase)